MVSIVWEHLILIIITTLLLNSGALLGLTLHVDSWIVVRWLHDRDITKLKNFYRDVGMPQHAQILKLLWSASKNNLRLGGIALVIIRILHSISIYLIIIHCLNVNSSVGLLITLLAIAYPSQVFIHDFQIAIQYGILWPAFIIGVALNVSINSNHLVIELLILILSIILTLYSFAMKSILVASPFAYGSLLFDNVLVKSEYDLFQTGALCFMVLLPFVYWYLNEKYFPRQGNFQELNQFLHFSQVMRMLRKIYEGMSKHTFGSMLSSLKIYRNTQISFLILIITSLISIFNQQDKSLITENILNLKLLIFGLISLLICVFPYAVVDQDFDSVGYLTKNALMCDISYGVLITATILALAPDNLEVTVSILLILAGIFYNFTCQYKLWIQYAKQCELLSVLQQLPDKEDLVFIVQDCATHKQEGKKSKLYPMTLFFMANKRNKRYTAFGIEGNFATSKQSFRASKEMYSSALLPQKKAFFNPKSVYLIKIEDGFLTPLRVLRFAIEQRTVNPFINKSRIQLFKIECNLV